MDTTRHSLDSILSHQSFSEWYHGKYSLAILVEDARKRIGEMQDGLDRESPKNCSLFQLLNAMLTHAPTPEGQRYVASVLLAIPHTEVAVVQAAKVWLTNLFYPIVAISRNRTLSMSAQSPSIEDTTRNEQTRLRKQVFERERDVCPVTDHLNMELKGDPRPNIRSQVCVAHIIPLGLSSENIESYDMAQTWELLRNWTCLDIESLVGSDTDYTKNAICMDASALYGFGRFSFYFDGSVHPEPNRYRIRSADSEYIPGTNVHAKDCTFNDNPLPPPDPKLLAIHAAFARVLHTSGAADYIEETLRDIEEMKVLSLDGSTDVGFYVASRAVSVR